MTEPGSDHGMFSPGNEAGIDPKFTDLDTLAATVRLAVMRSMLNTGMDGYTHDEYDAAHAALGALVEHARSADRYEKTLRQIEAYDTAASGVRGTVANIARAALAGEDA